ncbi:MAG TPA: hypothetical protein VNH21_12335 [Steroidobacteraceae bacterium]|nr:hypothetical protein [Steroidobacteraceae bacterium]
MTDYTLILPYDRASPAHIPRRDLVLSAADSLSLRITVVESDNPNAGALTGMGVPGGPGCTLIIWSDGRNWWGDYGAPTFACPGYALWTGAATISDAVGSFELFIPAGTMAAWPPRCSWAVRLDFDTGTQGEVIAHGSLHVRRVPGAVAAGVPGLGPPPPFVPPTVGPVVEVEFTLDRDQLDMGAMLAAGSDGFRGQPGGIGAAFFVFDVSQLDMGVPI